MRQARMMNCVAVALRPPGLMGMTSARRLHVPQVADTTRWQSFHEV
ncbi:hypothetical protein [Streptomyces sp. NPDC031705]